MASNSTRHYSTLAADKAHACNENTWDKRSLEEVENRKMNYFSNDRLLIQSNENDELWLKLLVHSALGIHGYEFRPISLFYSSTISEYKWLVHI